MENHPAVLSVLHISNGYNECLILAIKPTIVSLLERQN